MKILAKIYKNISKLVSNLIILITVYFSNFSFVLAQDLVPTKYPFLVKIKQALENESISGFFAGLIFASLIYLLIIVKHPLGVIYSISQEPAKAFEKIQQTDESGTYTTSYSQFKQKMMIAKGAFFSALIGLIVKILAFLIITIIFLHFSEAKK